MGAWTEIVDFTFTANETSRAFTGLNITKDDFIKVVITHVVTTSSEIRLFPNTAAGVSGFNTNTNYHTQRLLGFSTTVSSIRENKNLLLQTNTDSTNFSISYFKISENGKTNTFTNEFTSAASTNPAIGFSYSTSSNLTFNDPITSLTFTASNTDQIRTGSRIQIYRLDAEKVADFVTTSNATQVDIPFPTGSLDPAINKDSEYLLVGEVIGVGGQSYFLDLFPNDLTTSTNYNRQLISASGTSTSAGRTTSPQIASGVSGTRSLFYTHIKLSEIGAYTHQSYQLRNIGSNDIQILNWFISSTAENITSITKFSIISSNANTIGSGTRFILYKLK
jgi:hypothetical protein